MTEFTKEELENMLTLSHKAGKREIPLENLMEHLELDQTGETA